MNSAMATTTHETVDRWRRDFAASARIESSHEARFRYSYLCRLIDDRELEGLPEPLRSRAREVHKATYRKNLSLLRRDAEHVLRVRREKMAAEQEWNFQLLVDDYARVRVLIGKLKFAGLCHALHLGAGLDSARQALREFESILTAAVIPGQSGWTPAAAQGRGASA
jgi:hypothetical protein